MDEILDSHLILKFLIIISPGIRYAQPERQKGKKNQQLYINIIFFTGTTMQATFPPFLCFIISFTKASKAIKHHALIMIDVRYFKHLKN
jgi:hypothetical protein